MGELMADTGVMLDPKPWSQTAKAIGAAVVVMALIVTGAIVLVDQLSGGPASRAASRSSATLLRQGAEDRQAAECRSLYASSEAASATKYRHAQTVLVKAVSGIGDLSVPDALHVLASADDEQVRYTVLRLQSNELCDPPGDVPPILPPPIDPPEVTP